MNCQQFTSLIVEAARGRMMDVAVRDGAMRHAETCAACAARLAQEQNLASALRTLAADMKDLSAPARVEAKLLAAFQETLAASSAATTNVPPAPVALSVPVALHASEEMPARLSPRSRPWINVALKTAIAASLALVALVALYSQFTRIAPPREMPGVVARVGNELSTIAPAPAVTQTPSTLPAGSTGQATRHRSHPAERAGARRTSPAHTRAVRPAMIASRQVIDGGHAIFSEGEGESAANGAPGVAAKPDEAESVTEFIPLVAGAPAATPLDGGQLVRVQLPRAALASLGLPLNAERGNEERIRADVLLGNDGMARAIRFVR